MRSQVYESIAQTGNGGKKSEFTNLQVREMTKFNLLVNKKISRHDEDKESD